MRAQRGISLIEVMVAVIIFSVGLLGLAALQLNSIRFNESASVRGHAIFLAQEMADRIRARPPGLDLDSYKLAKGDSPSCANPATCAANLRDLSEWRTNLLAQLPSGTGTVAVDGNRITITVIWSEQRVNGAAEQTISTVTRM